MKWSSPLVELIRPVACLAPPARFVSPLVMTTLMSLAGCSALPSMQSAPVQVAMADDGVGKGEYSDAEKRRLSELPAIPDFDEPRVPAVTKTPEPIVLAQKPAEKPASTPAPAKLQYKPIETNPAKSEARASVQPIVGAGQKGVTPSAAPASVPLPMLRIDAPKPFAWKSAGTTSGSRSFQTVSVGDEGYRSLVIGSVAGEDPLALELVEQLARHLHNGKTILGGFQSTIIRTLNPDGEALHKILNEKGQYINHGFPKEGGIADANQPVEVTFLLHQIQTLQPQRVIHIRTIEGNSGLIAASSGCRAVANDAAKWLDFRVISLPEKAVSGSLERHLASSGNGEIITFAIPASSKKDELWDRYGDTLQNLLMGDDYAARELARQQTQESSASRQNADGK